MKGSFFLAKVAPEDNEIYGKYTGRGFFLNNRARRVLDIDNQSSKITVLSPGFDKEINQENNSISCMIIDI